MGPTWVWKKISNDVVVGSQGTGLVGLVDGSHLGWKMMSNDVVVGFQGTGLVGLVDGWAKLCSERPQRPLATTTLATLPCSNSALEFIKYPGVDCELLIRTPS